MLPACGITSAQCQRHRRGAALAPFAAEYTPGLARPGAVLSAPRRGVFRRSYAGDPAPERFAAHAVNGASPRPDRRSRPNDRQPATVLTGPSAVGPIPPEMAVLPVEDQETLDLSPEARQRVEIMATRSARSRSGRRPARTARCPRRRGGRRMCSWRLRSGATSDRRPSGRHGEEKELQWDATAEGRDHRVRTVGEHEAIRPLDARAPR